MYLYSEVYYNQFTQYWVFETHHLGIDVYMLTIISSNFNLTLFSNYKPHFLKSLWNIKSMGHGNHDQNIWYHSDWFHLPCWLSQVKWKLWVASMHVNNQNIGLRVRTLSSLIYYLHVIQTKYRIAFIETWHLLLYCTLKVQAK